MNEMIFFYLWWFSFMLWNKTALQRGQFFKLINKLDRVAEQSNNTLN